LTVSDDAGGELGNRLVSWVTSDSKVIAVDGTGKLTAMGIGTATITVMSEGQRASLTVSVNSKVASVKVTPDNATLPPGAKQQFAAAASDADGKPISGGATIWASSDAKIASIDDTGMLTAVVDGDVTIT